ncbi:aldo/keto reductase [Borreliella lusitaniae]|uniref:aldo/keto reductase n=1 Tax=Borreliella lusitaniae TaxID=100177 RepID=UPI00264A218D|nr:aldo/keto reductase [Borreliella lusitaniae]WKC85431.1 aldo/keto reductase [Borreliella lusitaniae]
MNNLKEKINAYSKLILGSWQFGGGYFKQVKKETAKKILKKAYSQGIRNIDTAKAYGNGISEKIIGEVISKDPTIRENILIASKCYPIEISEYVKNFNESLENLKTDYIDIYYIHWPKNDFDLRPIASFLEEMRAKEKIKYVGVSNFEISHMESIKKVCKIDVNQIGYNPLFRNKEKDVIPYCEDNDIAIISYSTIAQGLLSKANIKDKTKFNNNITKKLILFKKEIWPYTLKTINKLEEIAKRNNLTILELTYSWLKKTQINGFIVGFSKENHVESNLNSFKADINEEVYKEITSILDNFKQQTKNFPNLFNKKI